LSIKKTSENNRTNIRQIILLPNRSFSPSLIRHIKESKVENQSWPNPGVFQINELAKNIVNNHRSINNLKIQNETLLNFWDYYFNCSTHENPKGAENDFNLIKKLLPYCLSNNQLKDLILQIENNSSESITELNQWTILLLDYIKAKLYCQKSNKILSNWNYIDELLNTSEQEIQNLNWNQIFFLPQDNLEIFIPTIYQQYLGEKKLIKKLKQKFNIKSLDFFNKNKQSIALSDQDHKPQCLLNLNSEINHQKISQMFPNIIIDPPTKPFFKKTSINLSKYNKLSYEDTIDIIINEISISKEVITKKLSSLDKSKTFLQYLLTTIQASDDQTPSNIFNKNGLPIFTIKDIPYCGMKNIGVLSNNIHTKEDVVSWVKNNNKQEVPEFINKSLLALGIEVVEQNNETSTICNAIYNQDINLIPPKPAKPNLEKKQQKYKSLEINKFSPSIIESYNRCPQQFYYNKLLRDPWLEEENPVNLKNTLKGIWLHKILENLSTNKNTILKEVIIKSRNEIISKTQYSKYKLFCDEFIYNCETKLPNYIVFEKELISIMGNLLTTEAEVKLSTKYNNQEFSAIIDRINVYNSGIGIIDFKSSDISGKAKTLLNNYKLQLFFYIALINQEQKFKDQDLLFSAYVPPLEFKKSNFLVSYKCNDKLTDFLTNNEISFTHLTLENERTLLENLSEIFNSTVNKIKTNIFPPNPLTDSICTYCDYYGICGRPFFKSQGLDL